LWCCWASEHQPPSLAWQGKCECHVCQVLPFAVQ
jgi:hypothetical protein